MDRELIRMLTEENKKLKECGCKLAIASTRVIQEYDGLHRLSMAVSDWFKILANENGRDKLYQSKGE